MGGCLCLNRMVPQPASKYPVKRYNLLVPDIFAIKPPKVDEDMHPAVIKKIEKLGEYVLNNPQRASKVSRRLYRSILKQTGKKEPDLGYVKVAIHAYTYLLAHDMGALYAQELVKCERPVVEILLNYPNVHLRILGAELLAHFLRQQKDSDNLSVLHSFISMLCQNCQRETPSEIKSGSTKSIQELKVACLRGMREHVALMHRLSASPTHLDIILGSVMDNLDYSSEMECSSFSHCTEASNNSQTATSPKQMIRSLTSSKQSRGKKGTSMDFNFFQKTAIPEELAHASTPSVMAAQVVAELGDLTKAAGNAEKVMRCMFHQFDIRKNWSDPEIVFSVFGMMREAYAQYHHQFLLFTVLLRHAAAANYLSASEQTSAIQLAIHEGLTQDFHLMVTVLAHLMAYLPCQLPPLVPHQEELIHTAPDLIIADDQAQVPGDKKVPMQLESFQMHPLGDLASKGGDVEEIALRNVILGGIWAVASRVEDLAQLVDTLHGFIARLNRPLAKGDWSAYEEIAILECLVSAAKAARNLAEKGGQISAAKYDLILQELFILHWNSSSQGRPLVSKIIRLHLPLMPNPDFILPLEVTVKFLSVIYHCVLDPNTTPCGFAEIGHTFQVMMARSCKQSFCDAFQLVRTFWSEATTLDKPGCLANLSATHKCAVLMLCRSMVLAIKSMRKATVGWTSGLEKVMKNTLKFDSDLLVALSSDFPGTLEGPCAAFLDNVASDDLILEDLVSALASHIAPDHELPQEVICVLGTDFKPQACQSLGSSSSILSVLTSASSQNVPICGENESAQFAKSFGVPCSPPSVQETTGRLVAQDIVKKHTLSSSTSLANICTLDEILEIVDGKIGTTSQSEEGLDFTKLSLSITPVGF